MTSIPFVFPFHLPPPPPPPPPVSVVPRSDAWKKKNQDVITAKNAKESFMISWPAKLQTLEIAMEYINKRDILDKAIEAAESILDKQEEDDLRQFRQYHLEFLNNRLQEIKAAPRYFNDIYIKQSENSLVKLVMQDISDSHKAYELVWQIATEIYRMFPNFLKSSGWSGLKLTYSTKFPKYSLSLCDTEIFSNLDAFQYLDIQSNKMLKNDLCPEFQDYVNSIYFQIQEKNRNPFQMK